MLAAGGYWYVRNLVAVGNPIPYIGSVGPISLPAPVRDFQLRPDFAVVHYWNDTSVWRHWFFPGLHESFGTLWPATLVAMLGGGGVRDLARPRADAARARRVRARHRGRLRVHPADRGRRAGAADRLHLERPLPGAGGGRRAGDPALPARRCARRRARRAVVARRRWPSCSRSPSARWSSGTRVTSRARSPRRSSCSRSRARSGSLHWRGLAGVRRGRVASRRWRWPRRPSALAAGYAEQRHYLEPGLRGHRRRARTSPVRSRWARDLRDARIAVAGIRGVFTQYPFYGADLSNRSSGWGPRAPRRLQPDPRLRRVAPGDQRRRLHARRHDLRPLPPRDACATRRRAAGRSRTRTPTLVLSDGPGARLPDRRPARPRRMQGPEAAEPRPAPQRARTSTGASRPTRAEVIVAAQRPGIRCRDARRLRLRGRDPARLARARQGAPAHRSGAASRRWLSGAVGFAALVIACPLLIRLPGRATTVAVLLAIALIATSSTCGGGPRWSAAREARSRGGAGAAGRRRARPDGRRRASAHGARGRRDRR